MPTKKLTAKQVAKLETIIGKLEMLQLGSNSAAAGKMAEAKSLLLSALYL